MIFANLSNQERTLYLLATQVCTAGLVLGLLGGLISFSGRGNERADNWRASQAVAVPDTIAEFAVVSDQPRWFVEGGAAADPAKAAEAARKALEGQPESLKLIGIVDRAGGRYALFVPVNSTVAAGAGPKGVAQFAEGDTLVGDWKVQSITQNMVTVAAMNEKGERQVRELLLYQAKK